MTSTPDRVADYRLQVGFGGGIGGRFRFGISTFGGSDTFQTNWAEFFNGPDDDLTDDVVEGSVISWSRGSDNKVSSMQSGQLTFEVLNAATPYLYDPQDPASPLANGTVSPGFVPMRPVQLIGNPYKEDTAAGFQGLFYGFVKTASFDPETKICTVTAEDLLYWLFRMKAPVIAQQTGITSSAAVALLLSAIGWTDPSLQVLEANPSITSMNFVSDGSQTVLALLQGIVDAEQGYVFVDGNGAFHFEGRYARDARRTSLYDFEEATLIGISSGLDADSVINQFTVTADAPNGTGAAQVASDATSQNTYGVSAGGEIASAYFSGDAEALELAQLLLQRTKDSHPPQQAIIDNSTSAMLAAQLALNPQDRITVSGQDCYVEQVNHQLAAGGLYHLTSLLVTEAPAGRAFQFGGSGYSTFGSHDYFG